MMLLFPRLWSATTMLLPLLLTMSVTLTQAFQRPRTALRISERPFVRAGSTLSMSLDSNPQIVSIEYCTGCRWMLKSMWLAQELLMTFEQDLDAVIITPSDSKGIFEVCINNNKLWDRKERGGFPSPKELKQIVRDAIDPSIYLGHSDTEQRKAEQDNRSVTRDDTNIIFELSPLSSTPKPWSVLDVSSTPRPTVTIYYCTGCRWLLRAAYFGQELLTTFTEELKSVSLVPSKPPEKGGRFSIELDGKVLFDRSAEGRFPEVKEIKQMVRDQIVPTKNLGHSDIDRPTEHEVDDVGLDDDEAAEARRYFGVM